MRRSMALLSVLLFTGSIIVGCGSEPSRTDSPDESSSNPTSNAKLLGWLDAFGMPSASTTVFVDEETQEEITPGGIELAKILSDGVAAKAGLKPGDTILRIGSDWVPFKEDPTLDVMRLIEQQVAAGHQEIELGLLAGNELKTKTISHELTSLDEGLPLSVARYDLALEKALTRRRPARRRRTWPTWSR